MESTPSAADTITIYLTQASLQSCRGEKLCLGGYVPTLTNLPRPCDSELPFDNNLPRNQQKKQVARILSVPKNSHAGFGMYSFEVLSSQLQPGCAESAIVNGILDLMAQ